MFNTGPGSVFVQMILYQIGCKVEKIKVKITSHLFSCSKIQVGVLTPLFVNGISYQ